MALIFNEVLRPRPGLLVIRQTRFEPTLKTLAGLGILGIGAWLAYMNPLTSLRFLEGLAWLVPVAFMSLILIFGLALIFSGILQLIQPVEHHFDHRNKSYLRNNNMIARFDEIEDFYIRRRTSVSNGGHSTVYQLYLVLRSRKPIKLMKTSSRERALELEEEMTSAIGLKPEQAEEDITEKRYLSWTYPPWLERLFWPIIGLFIVVWVNGFFDLGLLPEKWIYWIFGMVFTGIFIIIVGSNFGKFTRTASKNDVHKIFKESQISKKIRVISIIISILTIVIAIYFYFNSASTKKENPVNTNSIIREISLLDEKFSFSSKKMDKRGK